MKKITIYQEGVKIPKKLLPEIEKNVAAHVNENPKFGAGELGFKLGSVKVGGFCKVYPKQVVFTIDKYSNADDSTDNGGEGSEDTGGHPWAVPTVILLEKNEGLKNRGNWFYFEDEKFNGKKALWTAHPEFFENL